MRGPVLTEGPESDALGKVATRTPCRLSPTPLFSERKSSDQCSEGIDLGRNRSPPVAGNAGDQPLPPWVRPRRRVIAC